MPVGALSFTVLTFLGTIIFRIGESTGTLHDSYPSVKVSLESSVLLPTSSHRSALWCTGVLVYCCTALYCIFHQNREALRKGEMADDAAAVPAAVPETPVEAGRDPQQGQAPMEKPSFAQLMMKVRSNTAEEHQ